MDCKWLPNPLSFPGWNNYANFEEFAYKIFVSHYMRKDLDFREKPIRYKHFPYENHREEAFYHIICENYNDLDNRYPVEDRIIRILWPRAIIVNYNCADSCCNNKPKHWWRKKYGKNRHKIYFDDYRYIVILEERNDYYLFITGYYVDGNNSHEKNLKEYRKYT